jgi:hypothetical protein
VNIQRFFIGFAVLVCALTLTGCQDGGGNGDLYTPNDPAGKFLDGQVSGLGYDSYTWRDGTTDENGEFIYAPGEEVTFSVGGINLGTVKGKENITPVDLAPSSKEGVDPAAINMTRFLMSIDLDGNTGNGIVITEETSKALDNASLDFDSPDFDAQATAVIEALDSGGIISEENGPRELVSSADAEAYLSGALAAIEAEEAVDAEEAAILECSIQSPCKNVVLIEGESVSLKGQAQGGSGSYAYQWALNGKVVSTSLNPGHKFSSLGPGTYELQFTVTDSSDAQCTDRRLVTVLKESDIGHIPGGDQLMQFVLEYTGSTTIRVGETFEVKALILHGNPPFFYEWICPTGVSMCTGEDPLDVVFTFPTQGVYLLTAYFRDSVKEDLGPDSWYQSVSVTVVP